MLLIELISISNMGVSLIETCFCSRLYGRSNVCKTGIISCTDRLYCETKYFYMVGSQNSAQNIEKIAHCYRLPLYSTRSQNGFCKKKMIGNLLAISYFKNSSKKVHYCILHVLKMVLQEKKLIENWFALVSLVRIYATRRRITFMYLPY